MLFSKTMARAVAQLLEKRKVKHRKESKVNTNCLTIAIKFTTIAHRQALSLSPKSRVVHTLHCEILIFESQALS